MEPLLGPERREAMYRELLPRLRSPSGNPLREVDYPNGEGRVWSYCPAHPDGTKHHNRSLSLSTKYGLECFAGCGFRDILDGLGVERKRPTANGVVPMHSPPPYPSHAIGEPTRVYVYRGTDGTVVAEKGRWEQGGEKTFRWRKMGGTWAAGIAPLKVADMPLWGAELVANAPPEQPVYLVEGEKATEACRTRGLLAVTLAGGASTTDFGDALEVLRGRVVRLWPDNDAVGRGLMQRVDVQLRDIASRTSLVVVDVAEKGDAFDYFATGGTLEAIEVPVLERSIREFLDTNAIRVRLPSVIGEVIITCRELQKSVRALDTDVRVELVGTPGRDPLSARLNIQSLSQVTEFRRTLDALYDLGKDFNWTKLLNQAFTLVRDGFLGSDPSVDTAEIEFSVTQAFHVDVLLPNAEPTVIFGDGSAGKSYLVFALISCAALGQPFCGLQTRPGRWMVLDYETGKPNYGRRMGRVAQGLGLERMSSGLVRYRPSDGIPLPDLVDALRRTIDEYNIVGLVIDSAAAACGGEPEKADVALRYFRSLFSIGITTITVAHINRGGDTERPFGSTFWHNEARRTWYVERVNREESDLVDLGFFCKKVNDGRLPRPFGIQMVFDGADGPVTFSSNNIRDVPQLDGHRKLEERIWDILSQPMTLAEIGGRLDVTPEAARKCMSARRERFTSGDETNPGGRGVISKWSRHA